MFVGFHPYSVLQYINNYFEVKYNTFENKINKETNVFLFNHLSFADYFIDNYILEGRGCYLSRYLVFFAIPMTSIYALITRQIYFFNRSEGRKNIGKIIDTICNKWQKVLIMYPEGTRNTTGRPIPLKIKGLKEIFHQNLKCQIINVKNKEKVFNEKLFIINNNITCNVNISDIIDPKSFISFDDFFEHVNNIWIQKFTE
jgi:hypothetical protein